MPTVSCRPAATPVSPSAALSAGQGRCSTACTCMTGEAERCSPRRKLVLPSRVQVRVWCMWQSRRSMLRKLVLIAYLAWPCSKNSHKDYVPGEFFYGHRVPTRIVVRGLAGHRTHHCSP